MSISREMATAFERGWSRSQGNTRVQRDRMILHNSTIAARHGAERTFGISLAGHATLTTRNRLNAVLEQMGVRATLYQRRGKQYLHLADEGRTVEVTPDAWYYFRQRSPITPTATA